MEQTLGVLFGLGLTLTAIRFAVVLRKSQLALETAPKDEPPDETAAREAEARATRRRWQTAIMLAVLGLALAMGVWIPHQRFPTFYVVFWVATAVLVCWIALLAAGDLLLMNRRASRLFHKMQAERATLDREYREAKLKASLHRSVQRGPDDEDRRAVPRDEFDPSGDSSRRGESSGDRPDASLN
ncbi:MAG TPA: hypothetical protein VGE52_16140 [Pirellulales bacterium]